MSWSRYHSLSLSFAHMLARVRRLNQKRARSAARASGQTRRPRRKSAN